jgi:hypothetical protein
MAIGRKYSYPDIIRKLADMKALAQPVQSGETAGAFTSGDRSSRYNDQTGTYECWDANDDGSGFIRREGDSIVVFEADGPGVIWRIWSALPKRGHIRIFIDGGAHPVVDMPFQDFFQSYNKQVYPANFPNLMPVLSRGRNTFLPISYQKSCKILLDPDWGAYYHITYTKFSEDTSVPSFDGTYDNTSGMVLAQVDRELGQRGLFPKIPSSPCVRVNVQPGQTVEAIRLHGMAAIKVLRVYIEFAPDDDVAATLRELTISMAWDGETEPSVWSPLGDLFGAAPGIQPYRSLPLGMDWFRLYCNWYMPYTNGALINFTNEGTVTRSFTVELELEGLDNADELLRFHAKWHRNDYRGLDTKRYKPGGDRWPDWPLLRVQGSGRFCGVHLHVYNAWHDPQTVAQEWWYGLWDRKSIDWWWGEGDEKFFIDGEKMPSTYGTGSEDYVGFAWSAEPPFSMFDSAFACQPFTEINCNGHTCVNRFHIADNIPFQHSFEGFIEKYKDDCWGEGNKCLFAATLYFYLSPGQNDGYPEVPVSQRWGIYHL